MTEHRAFLPIAPLTPEAIGKCSEIGRARSAQKPTRWTPLEIAAPASSSPLESLNSFLDQPFLDTNERGGAFEPLKKLIRAEPELAQVLASMLALAFFGAVGIVIGRLATGTLL